MVRRFDRSLQEIKDVNEMSKEELELEKLKLEVLSLDILVSKEKPIEYEEDDMLEGFADLI